MNIIKKILLLNIAMISFFVSGSQDFSSRFDLVKREFAKIKVSQDVSPFWVAQILENVDVSACLNQAYDIALSENCESVEKRHISQSYRDLRLGKKDVLSYRSRKAIESAAYHEVGHAVVSAYNKNSIVDDVVIEVRENTGGRTFGTALVIHCLKDFKLDVFAPDIDRDLNYIAGSLGGGVSEEVFNKKHTDLQFNFWPQAFGKYQGSDDLLKLFTNPSVGGSQTIFLPYPGVNLDEVLSVYVQPHNGSDLDYALDRASFIDRCKKVEKVLGATMFALSCVSVAGWAIPVCISLATNALIFANNKDKNDALYEGHARAKKIILENKDKVELLAQELAEKKVLPGERVYDVLGIERPKYHFEQTVESKKI